MGLAQQIVGEQEWCADQEAKGKVQVQGSELGLEGEKE
jgi:hypothetical protein